WTRASISSPRSRTAAARPISASCSSSPTTTPTTSVSWSWCAVCSVRGTPDIRVSFGERSRWIALIYAALLVVLLIVRLAIGDRTLWFFIVNAFFLYAFLPLPVLLVAAVLTRRALVIGVFVLAAAVWAWFWGALFLPAHEVHAAGPRLVVLAYNMLGFNRDVGDTLRIIRESAADLVALQELNPETAHAIER